MCMSLQADRLFMYVCVCTVMDEVVPHKKSPSLPRTTFNYKTGPPVSNNNYNNYLLAAQSIFKT